MLLCSLWVAACGPELGDCDKRAAEELVYGRNGMVATKGQALTHDSCGNGVFCHSASASGKQRHGVPKGMDFDMLPRPTGLSDVLGLREEIWDVVHSGIMPPPRSGALTGNGDWSLDVQRREGAPRLPRLSHSEGKAAMRNWLACGAPVVTDTRVPEWAQPQPDPFAGDAPIAWRDLYERVLEPSCALGGCHDANAAAGGLAMRDLCQTRTALLRTGACGKAGVRPGEPDSSFLVEKLEVAEPSCGDAMPPAGTLPESARTAFRRWIEAGAEAEDCP